jgi:Protein phosphatase 2C
MTTAPTTGFALSVAVATVSPRGLDSQDRNVAFAAAGEAAVVVCDGVGSYPRSGEVAELVCRLAELHLRESGGAGGVAQLPAAVAGSIVDEGIGATTLLALAADRDGELGYCMVGNGMVIEAYGLELDEQRTRMCFTELALPQAGIAGGRPTLASFLPWTEAGPLPSCLGTRRLACDRARLFLVCSDGIGSEEERPLGRAPDGTLWRAVDPPLAAVLDALADTWQTLCACDDPTPLLEQTLAAALERLLDEGALEDDATVGALLMRPDLLRSAG